MTRSVQVLDLAVIGPFMGHIERGRDGTTVRIDATFVEEILIEDLVKVIDGVIESQQHYLWYALHGQVSCCVMWDGRW